MIFPQKLAPISVIVKSPRKLPQNLFVLSARISLKKCLAIAVRFLSVVISALFSATQTFELKPRKVRSSVRSVSPPITILRSFTTQIVRVSLASLSLPLLLLSSLRSSSFS